MANETTSAKAFKTSDFGSVRRIVKANLASYNNGERVVKKAELEKDGIVTTASAFVVTLDANDAKSLESLVAGVTRLYKDIATTRKALASANGTALTATTPKGASLNVAPLDKVLGDTTGADPICEMIVDQFRSGQSLAFAQVLGKPLRDEAANKYGKPKADGSSSAPDTDV